MHTNVNIVPEQQTLINLIRLIRIERVHIICSVHLKRAKAEKVVL